MPKSVFFAGVVALTGAASFYGCGESQGDHPPVLNVVYGGSGYVSASGGSGGGSGGASGSSSGIGSGGSNDSGADGGDSGGSSGSSSGGSDGSADGPVCLSDNACNMLQLCGPQVNVTTNATAAFPMPMSGTILPGTYLLTAIDYYATANGDAGPGLSWQRQVIQLGATGDGGGSGPFQYDTVVENPSTPVQTQEGSASASGAFTVSFSCPTGIQAFASGYSATSTTLAFFESPLVFTYTKQ